jgi:site-specific DNA-methyltransferase (adenine-specific)
MNLVKVGNCVDLMRELPDNCIDLTVTSPPYDNLRKYNGFVFDFPAIAAELYRVTKPGGVVVWVVGDATIKGSETGASFRQALAFMELGFNLHDTMIYHKSTPPFAKTATGRYEQHFEYMFVFSRGRPKTANLQRVECSNPGKVTNRNPKSTPHEGKNNYRKSITLATKIASNVRFYGVGGRKTCTDKGISHPAMFPEKLAEDHILSWSNPGDLVFDPMCGAGTTLKMAKLNGRNYLGFDISEEYVEIAKKRLASCRA